MGSGKQKKRQGLDADADRARDVALFRYALIRTAADESLTTRQRGVLVRQLAAMEHTGPFGERVRISRVSLDRWIRAWRAGGFDALMPSPRAREPRTPEQVLDLAAALKREKPARTAVQVAAILRAHSGSAPSVRTLQRHFARLGLNTHPDAAGAAKAFGRFEAAAPNDRWTGDAVHGPVIGGRKSYLFAFIDDHSRALVGYRWGHSEDTVRLEAALRAGLAARGLPRAVYVDIQSGWAVFGPAASAGATGSTLSGTRPSSLADRLERDATSCLLITLAGGAAAGRPSALLGTRRPRQCAVDPS